MNKMIGLLLAFVLLAAATPAKAENYVDVDYVYRDGKTLVIVGSVACPSDVSHVVKTTTTRMNVFVYEKPIVTGGVCNEPRTPFTLRLPLLDKKTVYVNGVYWYTGEVAKKVKR